MRTGAEVRIAMGRMTLGEFGRFDGWSFKEQRLVSDLPVSPGCWDTTSDNWGTPCPEPVVMIFGIFCQACRQKARRGVCIEHSAAWNAQTMCQCGKADYRYSEPISA